MNTLDLTHMVKINLNGESQAFPRTEIKSLDRSTRLASYSRDYLVDYLLHYCRLCQKAGQSGTTPILEALLEVQPDNGEVFYLLGRQYELSGDLAASLDCFERAGALRPDTPKYTLAAVTVACLLNERSRALAMVCNVISAYPTLAEAYFERGVIFVADENWVRAQRDFEMCIRFEPNNLDYLTFLANACRQQGLYKLAHRQAQKALRIDPNYEPAQEELRQIPFFQQFVDFFRPGEAVTLAQ